MIASDIQPVSYILFSLSKEWLSTYIILNNDIVPVNLGMVNLNLTLGTNLMNLHFSKEICDASCVENVPYDTPALRSYL